MNLSKIIKKIEDRNSIIGIIGLGYVGLPLLIRFSEEGFNSIGFDVDRQKIEMLNNGKSYIKHISSTKIKKNKSNNFHVTSNFSEINKVDIIIICVPTPLGMHNEPDLTYIKKTIDSIKIFLKAGQVLILESTTYPGTTVEEIVPEIKSTDSFECIIGKNFFVGYSPEREDPGNKDFSTKSIPKVVSGISKNCLKVVNLIYSKIVDKTVPVSSTQVAEMTKIFENIHRAVNIGLVNELKVVADKMSIDIYEVINAAKTKPFGFTPYYPGPGLGGHCIPIDPYYLTWKAKEVGMNTRFIELAGEINRDMPKYVVDKIGEALNTINKSIKNSKVFILGLSYKKNVDDLRESPSLEIIDKLNDLGAKISFNDPFFDNIPSTRKYNFNLNAKKLTSQNINSADIVVLLTDHDDFDYNLIEKNSRLLVDTRGKFIKNKNKNLFKA